MSYSNKTLDLVRIVQVFLQKERELLDKMKVMQVRSANASCATHTSMSCAAHLQYCFPLCPAQMAGNSSSQVPVGPEQIVQRKLEQLKQRSEVWFCGWGWVRCGQGWVRWGWDWVR